MSLFPLFLETAELLHRQFGFLSLLYGSVGLEWLTGASFHADDIDILIPEHYVTGESWHVLFDCLTQHGYCLTDLREHTFYKNGVAYAFAGVEGLAEFAGIDPQAIAVRSAEGVPFLLLSLEQYLRVYERSVQDGYRIHIRKKKDAQKLDWLRRQLSGEAVLSETPSAPSKPSK